MLKLKKKCIQVIASLLTQQITTKSQIRHSTRFIRGLKHNIAESAARRRMKNLMDCTKGIML